VGSDEELLHDILRALEPTKYVYLAEAPVAEQLAVALAQVPEAEDWHPTSEDYQEAVRQLRDEAVRAVKPTSTGISPVVAMFNTEPRLVLLRIKDHENFRHETEIMSTYLRCVLCCTRCECGLDDDDHSRLGQQSRYRCVMCKVVLCKEGRAIFGGNSCWNVWHTLRQLHAQHPFAKVETVSVEEDAKPMPLPIAELQPLLVAGGASCAVQSPATLQRAKNHASPAEGNVKRRTRTGASTSSAASSAVSSAPSTGIKPRKITFDSTSSSSKKSKKKKQD
jgi:hypothetical protein